MNKTCNGMPGKCAEEDLVVYLAFTPIILLIYALRLIHRLDENSEILEKVIQTRILDGLLISSFDNSYYPYLDPVK